MFSYLMMWSLVLAGDPQTPEQLFNLAVAAEEENDYPTAILHFTEAIGAVTETEDLKYAIRSMEHVEDEYRKISRASPWPKISKRGAKAVIKQKDLARPDEMNLEAIDAAYAEHPYFQALLATNLLIREATANPQKADQYLLLAYFLKRDYPITYLALSKNAKRKGNLDLAMAYLEAFSGRVHVLLTLPGITEYTQSLGVKRPDQPAAPEVDLKALRKRMKAEPSAALFFEYATALANDPMEEREMIRYLEKAHDLEPGNIAILSALAKTVPDQKKDHELLPELMEAYRQHPQQTDLLIQAIRLAGRETKAGLTRKLLTEHPDDTAGYELMDLLAPEEVNPLLAEIPWLAQGTPARNLVYTHLENRKDPAAALDLFRELYRQHPDQLAVLENLVRYSAQSPTPEREQWLTAYRAMLFSRVRESMTETDIFAAQTYLSTANDLLDDKSIKVQCYFLRELDSYKFKKDELSALVETFPRNAYLHERFGDWKLEHKSLGDAKRQYKLARKLERGRPGVDEKIERIENVQAARMFGAVLGSVSIQLGHTPFSLNFGVGRINMDDSPIFTEGSSTLAGLTHFGLDPAIIAPIASRYAIICDNPAVEVLELLEAEP